MPNCAFQKFITFPKIYSLWRSCFNKHVKKKFCEGYPRRFTASLKNPKIGEYFFNIDAKLAQPTYIEGVEMFLRTYELMVCTASFFKSLTIFILKLENLQSPNRNKGHRLFSLHLLISTCLFSHTIRPTKCQSYLR